MKKISALIVTSLLVLSGCSTGGLSLGGKSNTNQEDITGTGLEITFDLDTKWIEQKKIGYTLEIENTGKEEIKLSRENFKLYTLQVDNTGTKTVFTPKSLEKFYDTVFDTESRVIYLPQNTKLELSSGQLIIDDWYFNNLNFEDFEYVLEIDYPTKTTFNNNIEITKSNKDDLLKISGKLSQAAPVQISKIILSHNEKEIYYLEYIIENKGSSYGQDFKVRLKEFDFNLGIEPLSECSGFILIDDKKIKISPENLILDKNKPVLRYICRVDLSHYDKGLTTTTTQGVFEYDYSNIITDKIQLPKQREAEDIFN
ncbi:MAG: hypothetical protein HRU03_06645 [Nanoarchaeales archaeon]|nr:hypothetical protein [Nanoarchaeales archaeon]